jgi:uncharacterized protein (DUF924 family)
MKAQPRHIFKQRRAATAADLVVCAADIVIDEGRQRASESAYRRGIHHGLALAGNLVDQSLSIRQAQRFLTKTENLAGEYRSLARHPGRPPVMDELRRRVLRLRKTKATGANLSARPGTICPYQDGSVAGESPRNKKAPGLPGLSAGGGYRG